MGQTDDGGSDGERSRRRVEGQHLLMLLSDVGEVVLERMAPCTIRCGTHLSLLLPASRVEHREDEPSRIFLEEGGHRVLLLLLHRIRYGCLARSPR